MKVTVRYSGQMKLATGAAAETIDLEAPCSPYELIARLAATRGAAFCEHILDKSGQLHSHLLLFVGNDQVDRERSVMLKEGDELSIICPIAGG